MLTLRAKPKRNKKPLYNVSRKNQRGKKKPNPFKKGQHTDTTSNF